MEEYQERVLVEQKELGEKIIKLTTFLINAEKMKVLGEQEWKAMLEYHLILIIRIRNYREPLQ